MRPEDKGAALGLGAGTLYFLHGEAGQEKESNCSYLSPWTTDAGAIIAAGVLYWQAQKTQNFWVGLVAGAITAIHVGQFAHFKAGGK
jgi:hypothetical protein